MFSIFIFLLTKSLKWVNKLERKDKLNLESRGKNIRFGFGSIAAIINKIKELFQSVFYLLEKLVTSAWIQLSFGASSLNEPKGPKWNQTLRIFFLFQQNEL